MNGEKREIKKGKLLIVGIILLVIIAIVVFFVIKKDDSQGGKKPEGEGQEKVYELPDLTYSDMQVTNVEMEYLADNNQTMVTFLINNTTENHVSKESLTAYLIDSNEETVGEIKTYIDDLAPGKQYSISVVMTGNLTSTAQIKLVKEADQVTQISTPEEPTTTTTNTTAENTNTVEDEEN